MENAALTAYYAEMNEREEEAKIAERVRDPERDWQRFTARLTSDAIRSRGARHHRGLLLRRGRAL